MKFKFVPESLPETRSSFPRLKITKDEEKARVVIMGEAESAFSHTLKAVQFDDNGDPLMTEIEKNVNGEKKKVPVLDLKYLGRFRCFGDPDIIQGVLNPETNKLEGGQGVDPDGCVMCKAAVETTYVAPPELRVAVHVARYDTKPKSFDIDKPFHVKIYTWDFNDRTARALMEYQKEIPEGNLSFRDLKLTLEGPESWKKYKLEKDEKALWNDGGKNAAILKEAWEENQCEDLESVAAWKKDERWIKADLKVIFDSYARLEGKTDAPQESATSQLSGLIGNGKNRKPELPTDDQDEEVATPVAADPPRRAARKVATPVVDLDDDTEGDGDEGEPVPANGPSTAKFDAMMANFPNL
jgi:hypothetical protein